MNQIKTLCYDMLLDIIDVAESKNNKTAFQSPNPGSSGGIGQN